MSTLSDLQTINQYLVYAYSPLGADEHVPSMMLKEEVINKKTKETIEVPPTFFTKKGSES